jgi:multidrug efflux pump subunit AcrA (membrane-fusion protein)
MKIRPKRGVVVAMLVAVAGAAGLGAYRLGRVQAAGKLPTAPVRSGEFLVVVRCRGELKARRSVQVSAPSNVPELRIVSLAPASSAVKEGDVVIRFDPSSAKRQLLEKEAELKQAQASVDQAMAQARITAEEDRRELSMARYQVERARLEVSKQEVVSALQGEESRIDLGLGEKKLRAQEATVALHEASDKAKIASLGRVRDKAQAEVNLTQERLAKMEVKAPMSGVVVYLPNYSQGWMNAKPFKVGDQVWPGAAVAEIPDLASLEMEGKIEEIDRGRVQAGASATVRVDSLPELRLLAKVARISPLTQMTWEWPPTSSFRGYAELQKTDARLQPGMNGSVDVVVERLAKATSIPAKALFTRQGRPVVYVQANGRYAPYEVKVVARNPDEVAIEGVAAGAQVTLVEPGTEGEKKA